MISIRTLSLGALLVAASAAVSSCLSPPEYPPIPEISFKDISTKRVVLPGGIGTYDSVQVTIKFQDGDGDLGLSNADTTSPFRYKNPDGSLNRYNNNYFFQPQIRKSNGEYQDTVIDATSSYDSRFPRLPPDDRDGPKRGTLTFKQGFSGGTFSRNGRIVSVQFRVKIVDRALHESNEITTEPITIK